MQIVTRLILTGILLYFVFKETGWATTTAIGLISVAEEVSGFTIKNILKSLQLLAKR